MNEPVALQPLQKTGRTYTAEDREAAYQVYRSSGGASLRDTSKLLGIALRTIAAWSHEDAWQKRLDADAAEAKSIIGRRVEAVLAAYQLRAIEQLQAVAAAGENEMARVKANELLLALAGRVAQRQALVRAQHDADAVPDATLAELQAMSPDELAARQRARALERGSR